MLEWKRNLAAHGDAREEKWRGKRRMERVSRSFQLDSEQSIQCYYNRSPSTRTARKPVLDWTDTPADMIGLVRFAGRPNLVSARVPSQPVFTLPQMCVKRTAFKLLLVWHKSAYFLCSELLFTLYQNIPSLFSFLKKFVAYKSLTLAFEEHFVCPSWSNLITSVLKQAISNKYFTFTMP